MLLIFSGTLLVLLTWAFAIACLVSIGLLPSLLIGDKDSNLKVIRAAIWWGLLVTTIFTYGINLVTPLRSGAAALSFLALIFILGIPGWVMLIRRKTIPEQPRGKSDHWILGAFVLTTLYFAATALGPITNYDSGLYHLGAIHYAGDFPTIPGLANVYFAFGYGNAEFPLAALLGNGPWNGEGYRLLNGLVVVLLLIELWTRWRTAKQSSGTYVLIAGTVMALVPMVALADYWVTSPSQDSSVFIVTLIAVAYICDFVTERAKSVLNCTVTLVLSILLVLLRPTMLAFAFGACVVIAVKLWRDRKNIAHLHLATPLALVIAAAALATVFAVLRDYLLSGWVQFPLSLYAFNVDWLAANPVTERTATLGYHRNPDDLWNAASGWGWVGSWISRLPSQWETFEFLGAAGLAASLMIYITLKHRLVIRWKSLTLALFPSVVAVAVWWLATPPSFRFIWGPLMSLPAIVTGWAIWRIAQSNESSTTKGYMTARNFMGIAWIPVLLVIAFTVFTRTQWSSITSERTWDTGLHIPYAVAEIPAPPTYERKLEGGVIVTIPSENEQCWDNYDLCTPAPSPGLRLRGTTVQDGFLQ